VFYGLGDAPSEDPEMAQAASEEKSETDEGKQHTPLTMIVPPAVLVALAVVVGLLPHLGPVVQAAAVRFQDQSAYTATVLHGVHVAHPVAVAAPEDTGVTVADVVSGIGSAAGAFVLACLGLYWRRLPLLRRGFEPGRGLVAPLRRFQSGVVNDYVTWIVIGLACLGGALAFAIRLFRTRQWWPAATTASVRLRGGPLGCRLLRRRPVVPGVPGRRCGSRAVHLRPSR
jgi:multicomponent Na+:H+ antiporter subunit D